MRGLLDDESLDGISEVQVAYRPERIAFPLKASITQEELISAIRNQCQIWGGAVAPLVPLNADETVSREYARILPGSAIDGIAGLHPHNLFHLADAKVTPIRDLDAHGPQLVLTLLEFGKAESYRPVEVVELDSADPWQMIYASCLGLLPEKPDAALLQSHNLVPELAFEDIIRVNRVRVKGSLDDLLRRLNSREVISPRKLSMLQLAYGDAGSTTIRTSRVVLPDDNAARLDAGPSVVVICSPGDIRDVALLWNLRGAKGDAASLPVGIPRDEATPERIQQLMRDPGTPRNGIPANGLYLTSASLSEREIRSLIGGEIPRVGIASYEEMLHLGYPGSISRNEVLVWREGKTAFVPLPASMHRDFFAHGILSPTVSMHADVRVLESPFPEGPDVRAIDLNLAYRAGGYSVQVPHRKRNEARELLWPSRFLMARTVASRRGFDIRESEPGRAAKILLSGLPSIADLSNLAHAPLLRMLEEMAARQGFGWYKNRLRARGQQADPIDSVGPTTDELPEKTFNEFKKALGNSDKATKAWLHWAEKYHLILKGFQLVCDACEAKQWVPVAAFAPPIICRGCARQMPTPFGDRSNVEFRYRLSERLRRVYEQDAMGHLLVARYFYLLLRTGRKGRLIGLHPGIEAHKKDEVRTEGEADVLLFTRRSEFIPVEVKRTVSGLTEKEVSKLEFLADFMHSPWSAVAFCQYGCEVDESVARGLASYTPEAGHSRVVLSYDQLLERHPIWGLGGDPFEWQVITESDIASREDRFIRDLVRHLSGEKSDWLTEDLLSTPDMA
ncbi:hypothetical protein OOK44_18415 [Streptomyces cellulosae]|uniref:hypothetical protein n=1 Tax=Streptomyces cellulosae TaxID=1968 RepID=UPI002254867D|nr:hypothetical protein [Streptomyces cellulosae]WTB82644.1 hypothetical protein OG837_15895 [Streptomyces cellulosae]WTC56796.1 hypothetical protein OH715_16610 [Streptomyces cellulosae]